jgi:exosortase E/protease (VPEID-CTERM system)
LLGLAVIAALTLAILPPRQLFPLVRQARLSLLLGSLVGMAAWIAGRAAEDLWEPLGRLTLSAVAQSLRWLFSDSFSVPSRMLVGTSTFRVIVAPVCSGFEGIGLMIVLLGCWLIACRRQLRFPNALLLVPLGIVMAWVGNVIRIVALIAIGSRWSPAVALGGFHSKAGWVLFCGAALGLMLVSRRAAFFAREAPPAETAGDSWNPTAAYLVPFLSGVGVQLVAGLFSIPADFAYSIQLLAVLFALWAYRKSYGRWRFSLSWAVPLIGAGAFACHFALEGLLGLGTASGSTTSLGLGVRPAGAASALIQLARTVIVVPLAEELAFRGYLLRRLVSADFSDVSPGKFGLASLLISSLAFGALQSNWIAGAVAGMLYAYAQYRRGRIADAFLAHAVTSLLAVAYSWWFAPLRHA